MVLLLLSLVGLFTELLEYKELPRYVILKNPKKESVKVLIDGKDWQGFTLKGDTLFLPRNLLCKEIKIQYESNQLEKTYFLYSLKGENNEKINSERKNRVTFEKSAEPSYLEHSIKVEGTKSISISTSQNGITLSQGMYANLSGYAGNLQIEGVVENSGSDQNYSTLRELDQAYLRLRGQKVNLQVGVFRNERYELRVPVLGLSGQVDNDRIGHLKLTYGEEKGLTNRMIFWGENGAQGPYILAGINGETNIEIIEGTEKVYIDGVLMKPGKNGDYVLDTRSSTLIFTPKRPILKGQKIEIIFQYRISLWKKKISQGEISKGLPIGQLSFEIFEEKDVGDPRRVGLTDWQIDSLKEWGDSVSQKNILAAFFVGEGKGSYKKEGDHFTFVGPEKGDYELSFTYVGEGNGSYRWDVSRGGYIYVGSGKGDYTPLKKIRAPSLVRLTTFTWKIQSHGINSEARIYGSERDLNTLSPLGDRDNFKRAADFKIKLPLIFSEKKGWLEFGGREKERGFYHPSLRWSHNFEEWFTSRDGKERSAFADLGINAEEGWSLFGKGKKIQKGSETLTFCAINFNVPIPRPLSIRRALYKKSGENPLTKREDKVIWKERIFQITSTFSYGIIKSDTAYTREFNETITKSTDYPFSLSLTRRMGSKERLDMVSLSVSRNGSPLSFSLNSSYLVQPEGEKKEKRALFYFDWRYTDQSSTSFYGEHQLNASSLSRKEERFVYVGLGNGDYRYDPGTGKYVPENGGDYRREFTNVVEISPATLLENLIGLGTGDRSNRISASFLSRKKYPGVGIFFRNEIKPFYDEKTLSLGIYSALPSKIKFSGDYKYSSISDGEISTPAWRREEKWSQVYFSRETSSLSRKLGLLYSTRTEGSGNLINWGNKDYGLFTEISIKHEKREIAIRLAVTRKWVKDLSAAKRWLSFNVVSLKPVFKTVYRSATIETSVKGSYGIPDGPVPNSPLFPIGWHLGYTLNIEKAISRKTKLSLSLLGDRGKGYPPRENLNLSLFTDF